jgi:hypothetical protein
MGGPVRRAVVNIIGWRLPLRDGMMKEKTLTGRAVDRTFMSRIITTVVRTTIDVHWTQRHMRRMMVTFVDHDRWRTATPEWTRTAASGADLRKRWEGNVSVSGRTT